MSKMLIVEDDVDIAELLSIHLSDLGYKTDVAYKGKDGFLKAQNEVYKVIILDIKLPDMDGFEICRQIRMQKNNTPIIMLTSKSEEIDKVLGLEIGADDYITKPFSVREFIARVKAMIRRESSFKSNSGEAVEKEIRIKDLYINVPKRIVKTYGNPIELSPKEFDLLVFLASNPGKTYNRSQLLNKIWGVDFEGYEHTVNSHINRLRSKIEKDMNAPQFILTTWGVGYKFKDNS